VKERIGHARIEFEQNQNAKEQNKEPPRSARTQVAVRYVGQWRTEQKQTQIEIGGSKETLDRIRRKRSCG
jgi:hypothetical protein